ncbi:hypothetical protein HPB50_015694 [Hyalomma asiaticum]|uniref:Uncharacterized protein n=1 Tax=Hyalomma asiaticum TaxID=266040 RepID=A0ACB7T0X9_HYAAI|nr:hypothetical protein HPB50_015694 [Hyalomma asiaticum]
MVTQKRAHHALTLEKKMDIIIDFESGSFSKTALATKHGVPKSSLTRILHDKDKLRDAFETSRFGPQRKRLRHGDHEELENEAALPVDDEPEFGSLELPGSFADYVGADDDVAVCSEVSLDDIIETVRPDTAGTSDEEEMDDAAEASVSVPTYADVLCYVDHIRRFACARNEIGDLLPDVAAIERKLMRRGWANSQKKITDFFKR